MDDNQLTLLPETNKESEILIQTEHPNELNIPVLKSTSRLACNFKLLSQLSQENDASKQDTEFGNTVTQDGNVSLQGIQFGGASTSVSQEYDAPMQGAECDNVPMQGAEYGITLTHEDNVLMQGAECDNVLMQGAECDNVPMQGAECDNVPMQGAECDNVPMQGAECGITLTHEDNVPMQGAECDNVPMQGAECDNVPMQGAEYGITLTHEDNVPMQGAECDNVPMQGAECDNVPIQGAECGITLTQEDNVLMQDAECGITPSKLRPLLGRGLTVLNKNDNTHPREASWQTSSEREQFLIDLNLEIQQRSSVYDEQNCSHFENSLDERKICQHDGWTGMDSKWPNIWSFNGETERHFIDPNINEAGITESDKILEIESKLVNMNLNGNDSKPKNGQTVKIESNLMNLNGNDSKPKDDQTLEIELDLSLNGKNSKPKDNQTLEIELDPNLNGKNSKPKDDQTLEIELDLMNQSLNGKNSKPEPCTDINNGFMQSSNGKNSKPEPCTDINNGFIQFSNGKNSKPEPCTDINNGFIQSSNGKNSKPEQCTDINNGFIQSSNGKNSKPEPCTDINNGFRQSSKITDEKMNSSVQSDSITSLTKRLAHFETKVEDRNSSEKIVINELPSNITNTTIKKPSVQPANIVNKGDIISKTKLQTERANDESSNSDLSTNKTPQKVRTEKMSTHSLELLDQLFHKNISELSKSCKKESIQNLTIQKSYESNTGDLSVANESPSLSDASDDSFDFMDLTPSKIQAISTQEKKSDAQNNQVACNTEDQAPHSLFLGEANLSPSSEPDISELYVKVSGAEGNLEKEHGMKENLLVQVQQTETSVGKLGTGTSQWLTEMAISNVRDQVRIKESLASTEFEVKELKVKWNNRDKDMEGRSFDKDKDMERRSFDRNKDMEGRSFDRDKDMEGRSFDRDKHMEGRSFDRDKHMEGRSFDRDKHMEGRSFDRDKHMEGRSFDKDMEGRMLWDSLLAHGKSQTIQAKTKTSSSSLPASAISLDEKLLGKRTKTVQDGSVSQQKGLIQDTKESLHPHKETVFSGSLHSGQVVDYPSNQQEKTFDLLLPATGRTESVPKPSQLHLYPESKVDLESKQSPDLDCEKMKLSSEHGEAIKVSGGSNGYAGHRDDRLEKNDLNCGMPYSHSLIDELVQSSCTSQEVTPELSYFKPDAKLVLSNHESQNVSCGPSNSNPDGKLPQSSCVSHNMATELFNTNFEATLSATHPVLEENETTLDSCDDLYVSTVSYQLSDSSQNVTSGPRNSNPDGKLPQSSSVFHDVTTELCNSNPDGKLPQSSSVFHDVTTELCNSNPDGKLPQSSSVFHDVTTELCNSNPDGKLPQSSCVFHDVTTELCNSNPDGKLPQSSSVFHDVTTELCNSNPDGKLPQSSCVFHDVTTELCNTHLEPKLSTPHHVLEENETTPDSCDDIYVSTVDYQLSDSSQIDLNTERESARQVKCLNMQADQEESGENRILPYLDLSTTRGTIEKTTDLTNFASRYTVTSPTDERAMSTAMALPNTLAMFPVNMTIEGAHNSTIIAHQTITSQSDQMDHRSNITDQTMIELNYERELFTKTSSFKVAYDVLTEQGVIFIVGPPGSGKTMMARKLVKTVCKSENKNQWKPLILKFPWEWRHVTSDEKQVILMEDVFGVNSFNTESFFEWKKLNMECLQNKETKRIIFTLRTQVSKDAFAHFTIFPLFKYSRVVDVVHELKDGKLSMSEKCSMLSNHMNHYGLTDKIGTDVVKVIVTLESLPNFPSCCKLFCQVRCLQTLENAKCFFTKPVEIFFREIHQLCKEKDKTKFASLVVTMVMNGELNIGLLDDNKKSDYHGVMRHYLTMMDISDSVTFAAIKMSAMNLLGTYLSKTSDNLIVFAHSSIHDAICLVYGQTHPDYLIRVCTAAFLHEYVIVSDDGHGDWMKLLLKPSNRSLSERFIQEIKNGHPVHVSMHEAFSSKLFIAEFIKTCEEMNMLNVLMSASSVNQLPMIYWTSWCKDIKFFKAILSQHIKQKRKLEDKVIFMIANGCCISGNIDVMNCIDKCLKLNILDIPSLVVPVPTASVFVSRTLATNSDIQSSNVVHAGKLIHIASFHGNNQIVEFLLNKDFSTLNKDSSTLYINSQDEFGRTASHIAAKYGHVKVFQTLSKNKCNLSIQSQIGNLPIHEACSAGQTEIVEIILKALPHHIAKKGSDSRTPLHVAVISTNVQLVEMLLNQNPIVAEDTLIHTACMQSGNSEVLRMLCQRMKDKNSQFVQNDRLNTPLHIVCEMTVDVDMVEILIEFGADINKTNVKYETALHLACKNSKCSVEVVRKLINSKVNLFVRDVSKHTALDYVSDNENVKMLFKDAINRLTNSP